MHFLKTLRIFYCFSKIHKGIFFLTIMQFIVNIEMLFFFSEYEVQKNMLS